MRRSPLVLALLAALAAPVAAGEVAVPSPWDGFGEGSWVIQKTTNKQAGDEAATGETLQRVTLTKVTDQAYTIKAETKVGDEWMGSEYDAPRVAAATSEAGVDAPKPEDLGTEKLTIDGVSVECRKSKFVAMGSTSISWTHEKHGVVKTESTGPAGESRFEILKFKAIVKVKGKDVECQVTRTTFKSPQMDNVTTTYASPSIPGGTVRAEIASKMTFGDTKSESTSVMEVTDFEKK